jgi:lipopolysaccharide transport system ATP-binding protein
MSDIAIHVENLGKLYRIGERRRYKTLRDSLSQTMYAPFRAAASLFNGHNGHRPAVTGSSSDNYIWSLKDVSFEIEQGEAVGVIGRNGAGKSTLLKILSRITKPTEGYVRIHGRVGALLEVGTGFHPELTGRENIYLNGAIIGMKKKEIDRKFDEIVAFAEVEKFIDTPVKLYSSGMYVRLAFAVAAHLEPEVLIVDEVLAVGDAAFQRKCLGKMDTVAKQGRTVLFVSHNMAAVGGLCSRAILLDGGQIKIDGPVSEVIEKYISGIAHGAATVPIEYRLDRTGDGRIRFVGLHWETSEGETVSMLRSGGDYKLVLTYECSDGLSQKNIFASFGIKDHLGMFLLLHQTNFNNHDFRVVPGRGRFVCRILKLPLAAGEYSMNVFVGTNEEVCDGIEDAAMVSVEYGDFFGTGHPGAPTLCKVLTECHWELQHQGSLR